VRCQADVLQAEMVTAMTQWVPNGLLGSVDPGRHGRRPWPGAGAGFRAIGRLRSLPGAVGATAGPSGLTVRPTSGGGTRIGRREGAGVRRIVGHRGPSWRPASGAPDRRGRQGRQPRNPSTVEFHARPSRRRRPTRASAGRSPAGPGAGVASGANSHLLDQRN